MLFNLIGNAIKFTFEGGISLSVRQERGLLITDVMDTGIGIRQDDLSKLFRFFGTLTKAKDINRGGMGLGLTISKMIVMQLGGEIEVESRYMHGSRFTFSIPLEGAEKDQGNIQELREGGSNHGFTMEHQDMPIELSDDSGPCEERVALETEIEEIRQELIRAEDNLGPRRNSSYSVNTVTDTFNDRYNSLLQNSA